MTNWNAQLLKAAEAGNLAKLQEAIRNDPKCVNKTKHSETSALISAARDGHSSCVKALIVAGADVNTKDGGSHTALMWAAYFGHASCIKILLAADADITVRNVFGTALDNARVKMHEKCVRLLEAAERGERPSRKEVGLPPLSLFEQREQQRKEKRRKSPDGKVPAL